MSTAFPIVGIGASAGGLEAFTELLSALPFDTGMAFVLIQHLDPGHKSQLTEILSHTTTMSVHEAADGMPVERNQIYVIPANSTLTIGDGILRLIPRPAAPNLHLPIDVFFTSLAEAQGPLCG
jgi:two-component system, chemotaxis family, CheB/CheR fusion protein